MVVGVQRAMGFLSTLRRIFGFTADDLPEYVCRGCGAQFELRRHVCPICGGFLIERTEWSDEAGESERTRQADRQQERSDTGDPGREADRQSNVDTEEPTTADTE